MSRQPIAIYSAASSQQAHLLKGLLQDQGIAAWVVNDAIQIAGGELPIGWTAAARVVVGDQDAVAARELAEAFDQQTAHEIATEDPVDPPELETWSQWPICTACGERRSARCTVCGVSGSRFLLADIQANGDSSQVLLKCESCDDLFQPEWYRLCSRCGHDFGDGIGSNQLTAATIELNRRSLVVLAVLLASLAAALVYFRWLFQ